MEKDIDVLGLGCVTVDDILQVDAFPDPDEKTLVRVRDRQCGGLTGAALIAAARFGCRCAYAGVLGKDDLSSFVTEALTSEGIDMSLSPRVDDARPIASIVVVDTAHHTRNIFAVPGLRVGCDMELPEEDILRAKVLMIDHYGGEATLRAARIARNAGIPVVADIERNSMPCFREILGLVDHLIVSEKFALSMTAAANAEDAAACLFDCEREIVIVTCGERGGFVASRAVPWPSAYQAYAVDPVDTTGCGDTFHGVYAACLAEGLPLDTRISYASAAAAITAGSVGAVNGIPRRETLLDYVHRMRPNSNGAS